MAHRPHWPWRYIADNSKKRSRGLATRSIGVDCEIDRLAAVDLLTDALLSHLSYEEHQILEPLARLGPAIYG